MSVRPYICLYARLYVCMSHSVYVRLYVCVSLYVCILHAFLCLSQYMYVCLSHCPIPPLSSSCPPLHLLLLSLYSLIRLIPPCAPLHIAYGTQYESSIAYGIRKALMAQQKLSELDSKLRLLGQSKVRFWTIDSRGISYIFSYQLLSKSLEIGNCYENKLYRNI